jgi:predicted nucleic acid-binding protein
VSKDGGGAPAPLILDVSVLIEIARGDTGIMTLIQDYDAAGQPMVVPALAVTAASIDMRNEEAADLLGGLELFENIEIAPLQGVDQAIALAAVMARTGLEPWDAHVAAIADASVCPILTLDAAKWRQHSETWMTVYTSSRSPTRTRRDDGAGTEIEPETNRLGMTRRPQGLFVKSGGAGGARTHDRRIMRGLIRCSRRSSCTDAAGQCR